MNYLNEGKVEGKIYDTVLSSGEDLNPMSFDPSGLDLNHSSFFLFIKVSSWKFRKN